MILSSVYYLLLGGSGSVCGYVAVHTAFPTPRTLESSRSLTSLLIQSIQHCCLFILCLTPELIQSAPPNTKLLCKLVKLFTSFTLIYHLWSVTNPYKIIIVDRAKMLGRFNVIDRTSGTTFYVSFRSVKLFSKKITRPYVPSANLNICVLLLVVTKTLSVNTHRIMSQCPARLILIILIDLGTMQAGSNSRFH